MIDNTTRSAALGFLIWFHQFYGMSTDFTYMHIASHYKQCNYSTIRNYMLELKAAGYISIENQGKRSQRFIINGDKFDELISTDGSWS